MRITLIILFIGLSQIGLSQKDFNNIYCFDFLGTTIENMIVFGDTIVTYGVGIDSFSQSLVVTKMDTFGVVYEQFVYEDAEGRNFFLLPGYDIVQTMDKGYICSATVLGTRRQFLLKIDQSFNLIWSEEYWQSPASIKYPYEIVKLDSGFIIGGFRQNFNATFDVYLTKVSLQGEFLWEKIYGEVDSAEFMRKIVLTSNQTLLLFANRLHESGNPLFQFSRAWFLEVDTLGTIRHEWLDANYRQVVTTDLIFEENHDFIYLAGDYKYNSDFNVNTIDWHITKRDSNYSLLWKTFPLQRSGGAVSLEKILKTKDSGYVTAGYLVNKVPQPDGDTLECYAATLFKADNNGEPLWQVCDTFDFGPDSDVEYRVSSLVELSSGSLIMAGTIRRFDLDPYKSFAWMLKYDKDGCRDTFCSFDLSTSTENILFEKQNLDISIYPNPASDYLNVDFTDHYSGELEIRLVNMKGKVVFKSNVLHSENNLQLPLPDFPTGIYFLQIIKESGGMVAEKIIIE